MTSKYPQSGPRLLKKGPPVILIVTPVYPQSTFKVILKNSQSHPQGTTHYIPVDFLFCLRPSGSETYKLACPWLTDWLPPSLPDWHPPSGRFVETLTGRQSPAVLTHHSLMLGLWNFNRTSLTTRQLMSNNLTYLFQLLTVEISC